MLRVPRFEPRPDASLTRTKLSALLRRIAGELLNLPEGSAELRAAHANLQNIRRALARPDFRRGCPSSVARPFGTLSGIDQFQIDIRRFQHRSCGGVALFKDSYRMLKKMLVEQPHACRWAIRQAPESPLEKGELPSSH
jgi:hypothetical protein